MEREDEGLGEEWDKIIFPAIAQTTDDYRKLGDPLQVNRYPLESLEMLSKSLGKVNFSCQYLQDPVNKESQEFHEEWFRYYEHAPKDGRIFTTVDPAFTKNESSDSSCIMTAKFVGSDMYILEYTLGKYDPGELIEKIIYHINKRAPEKVGIEAYQAQRTINFHLKAELDRRGIYSQIEDIIQS